MKTHASISISVYGVCTAIEIVSVSCTKGSCLLPLGSRWSIWLGRNGCNSRTVFANGNHLRAGLPVSVAASMVRSARLVGRIEEGDNLWHQHV